MPIAWYKFACKEVKDIYEIVQFSWNDLPAEKVVGTNYVNLQFFITTQPLEVGLQGVENQPEDGKIDWTEPVPPVSQVNPMASWCGW